MVDKKINISLKEVIERETGKHFDRANKMCCPFHEEKTPSFTITKDGTRWRCWGCGAGTESGKDSSDVIDFIKIYKKMDFNAALKHLGIESEVSESYKKQRLDEDNLIEYIKKRPPLDSEGRSMRLVTLYKFVDDDNKVLYYKPKFKDSKNKSHSRYYSFKNGKILHERGCEEVPYNLYNLNRALKANKTIFMVEGEKDADTLNHFGYVTSSFKGLPSNFDYTIFEGAKICVCGDTGEAGEAMVRKFRAKVLPVAAAYKEINLRALENLGDNKDVTDWFQAGHTHAEFKECVERSLDLKNKYELQQDHLGIYKTVEKVDKEGVVVDTKKIYIANFNVVGLKTIMYVDQEKEGCEITFIDSYGNETIKKAFVTVFDDLRSFKNFLGTMALTFTGKGTDLDLLKMWLFRYFVKDTIKLHEGIKFVEGGLITPVGKLSVNGLDVKEVADVKEEFNLNPGMKLTKEEAEELGKHLFNFQVRYNCVALVGAVVNNMAYTHAVNCGVKLNHILVAGESGTGKSTIKRNVVNPLLGYSRFDEGAAIDKITNFALIKSLSEGNYTKIFDEYKPYKMSEYGNNTLSQTLRSAYDRIPVSRGNKDLSVSSFNLSSPIIIFGEQSYPDEEKALIERSLIVYLSKREIKAEHTKSMMWLGRNEALLNKLGSSILNKILTMSTEEYEELRKGYREYPGYEDIKDRPRSTFTNACVGYHILEEVFQELGAELPAIDHVEDISKVVRENVLNEGGEAYSAYEQMFIRFNEMIDLFNEDLYDLKIIIKNNGKLYIKTSLFLAKLSECDRKYGTNICVLGRNDFLKQAEKGRLILQRSYPIKIGNRQIRLAEINEQKLRELGCEEIISNAIPLIANRAI